MSAKPLFIVSGPSGSGKSTLIARLLEEHADRLRLAVSATTRSPRPGERDGVQYFFWTRQRFLDEIDRDGFLEWTEVHDQYYGSLREQVEPYRQRGWGVILDIDVQGMHKIRLQYPEAVTIFVRTAKPDDYAERLRRRGTESEEAIRQRLALAQQELSCAGEYQWQIVNDDLEKALAELRGIVDRSFTEGR